MNIVIDKVREEILEYVMAIKAEVEAIEEVYDALKLIAEKYPHTHGDLHLEEIRGSFDSISLHCGNAMKYIEESSTCSRKGRKM